MVSVEDYLPSKSVTAQDCAAVAQAVAKGLPVESAVRILKHFGMSEEDCRAWLEPASSAYEAAVVPKAPSVNVTVPKDAIRVSVEVKQAAAPGATVNVAPSTVEFPEPKPREIEVLERDKDGKIKRARLK